LQAVTPEQASTLAREHRDLDDRFGRFLAAAAAGETAAASEAIAAFDDALRLHTAFEEERIYPPAAPHALAAPAQEDDSARRFRELRLEHVQVRELSGMIRRLLGEKQDLEAARRLAPNFARRWDAHTVREDKELFGSTA
jgi:hypothetical protein